MSNHNYSQYSNKSKNTNNQPNPNYRPKPSVNTPKPAEETVVNIPTAFVTGMSMGHPDPVGAPGDMGEPGIELVEETVSTATIPELVSGTVVGCSKLNVRSAPSITGNVLAVISADSDVQIDVAKSSFEWFHVCTATGIEGYCMRKFVNAHL